ncbi:MAG: hypothetical protein AAGK78_09865 [Planctomycetota bacterium]
MLLLLGGSGCLIFGAIAAKTVPLPKKPAAYELQVVPTTITLVAKEEDLGVELAMSADPVKIGLRDALAEKTDVPIVKRDGEQVVEVTLLPMRPDGETGGAGGLSMGSNASARVRVLDGAGREVWPDDTTAGKLVTVTMPPMMGEDFRRRTRLTLEALGNETAKLFYETVED